MKTIWLSIEGGWDKSLDEVPKPEIRENLQGPVNRIVEDLIRFYPQELGGEAYDDVWVGPILEPGQRVRELLEALREEEDTLFVTVDDAHNELANIVLKYIEGAGEWRHMACFGPTEGSFYAVYRMEV